MELQIKGRPSHSCPVPFYLSVLELQYPTTSPPVQAIRKASPARPLWWNGTSRYSLSVGATRYLARREVADNQEIGPGIPETPASNLPLRNPRSFAVTSTPRTGVGTTTSVPGSGLFHQTSGSRVHTPDGLRTFPGARTSLAGTRRSASGGDSGMSVPSLGRAEGSYFCNPPSHV